MPNCQINNGKQKWNEYREPENIMEAYRNMQAAVSELEKKGFGLEDEAGLSDMVHSLAIMKKHLADTCYDHDLCRVCDTCEELMEEGYCIESGVAYYCSLECMEKDGMTEEEFLELYDDGEGDSYWTTWEG
ncbi:hypothetical protein CPT_Mater236 [Bacillus phage Mater]|uniref:Uncharacterized protein n=1 Tax=Bacillus phage Mater TaxID=1540090 RepID=A0A0A0RUX7_9CAUD|nr:hypothetical protein CPT_Mater14 [Bacillus phage Mater]YP_009151195.1 hypothetical protein CPT_Mater236 [Bacillus phage Mater]AIW03171.1 hypothetical protein CPT_Mater14 [Bacillus phage Mater]AIW03393.1 hypothetical protein CPT_Mater236 [Bacillus phage Mater]